MAMMSTDVDTFTISKWVGHASTQMIERVYAQLRPGHRTKRMSQVQFDDIFNCNNSAVAEQGKS